MKVVIGLICVSLAGQALAQAGKTAEARADADLRARVEASVTLPFVGLHFAAQPPANRWESGTISGIAVDRQGRIYEIQRGEKAAPILVLDSQGNVLRSWGKGDFRIPHSIRIDAAGNVWTVDSGSSTILEYSPTGKKLMTIPVGERPNNGSRFDGATDIAFGPNGHLFITDGYGNARVVEYSAAGTRIRQWGRPGSGAGAFNLPHAIQIGVQGTIYVADRENGRIEEFNLDGDFLGEIDGLGRVFSVKMAGDALWATIQTFGQPLTSGGWIVKIDPRTGEILGHLDVPQLGGHSMEVTPCGEPMTTLGNEVLWFRARTGD